MSDKEPVKINDAVAKAMEVILGEVTAIGRDRREALVATILDRLANEHRTKQQAFWDIILKVQIQYADFGHDLRNDAAVKLAGLVKKTATENNLDYGLPFI